MIEVKGLSAGYNDDVVLHDISFSVGAGEKICIVGPNGSGKSTLLKAMVGLLDFGGEVLVKGRDLNTLKRVEIARDIGFLSQMNGAYFSYSVFETVMLGRYAHSNHSVFAGHSKEDANIVAQCLEAVGVSHLRKREITDLSGGELQRVFLAKVFAQTPDIIMLDEPTNHLDLKYQIELMDYMAQWAEGTDRVVVAVLHDINLALRFADRILLLSEGRLVANDTKEEILSSNLLSQVYDIDIRAHMLETLTQWVC